MLLVDKKEQEMLSWKRRILSSCSSKQAVTSISSPMQSQSSNGSFSRPSLETAISGGESNRFLPEEGAIEVFLPDGCVTTLITPSANSNTTYPHIEQCENDVVGTFGFYMYHQS